MKGCGEAGTVGALAAVANAAQDALWDMGVRQVDMPLTSEKIWSLINSGTIAAE
jgi:carbon-monoxide dehydrogenase large subunit